MLLALAGCAGPRTAPDTTATPGAVVFGYFDMTAAPSTVEWIALRSAEGGRAYRIGARDGFFFHPGVEPGSYRIEKFGGSGGLPLFTRRAFEYAPPSPKTVRIGEAEVHFLGAYEFVARDGAPGFELKPARSPSEKELLQRVERELQSDKALAPHAGQRERVKRRLAEL